jgi:hypothetical protein
MTWRKARFGLFRYNSGFDRVAPTFPRLVGQRFPFPGGERKPVSKEVRTLIFRELETQLEQLAVNARRSPGRILGNHMKRWLTFLRNHREAITALDFFTVPTLTFGVAVAQSTVARYLPRHRKPPSQTWRPSWRIIWRRPRPSIFSPCRQRPFGSCSASSCYRMSDAGCCTSG